MMKSLADTISLITIDSHIGLPAQRRKGKLKVISFRQSDLVYLPVTVAVGA